MKAMKHARKAMVAVAFIAAAVLFAGNALAAQYYQVTSNSSRVINESGTCKVVTNSTSKSIWVPTKTNSEWQSFYGHLPSSVTASSCTYGCMDSGANNYNPSANVDDGSCDYSYGGCTDPSASNYDSGASWDDGSCSYPCASNAGQSCSESNSCGVSYSGTVQCDGSCSATPVETVRGCCSFSVDFICYSSYNTCDSECHGRMCTSYPYYCNDF